MKKNLNIDEQKYFDFVMNTGIINIIDWFNKKSIKLALKIYFVCICLAAGQASIDHFLNCIIKSDKYINKKRHL